MDQSPCRICFSGPRPAVDDVVRIKTFCFAMGTDSLRVEIECLLLVFWLASQPRFCLRHVVDHSANALQDCKLAGVAANAALVMPFGLMLRFDALHSDAHVWLLQTKLCFSHLSAAARRRPRALQRDSEAGARLRLPFRKPSRPSERRDQLMSRGGGPPGLSLCSLQV